MKVNHKLNAWIRANFDFIYEFGDHRWYNKKDVDVDWPMYKGNIVKLWIRYESTHRV